MFGGGNGKKTGAADTYIAAGTTINGNVHCQGCLKIDGIIKGGIKSDGDVILGKTGIITGSSCAGRLTIGGAVEGNISASGVLKILPTGRLNGDIDVGGLVVDKGGFFNGRCSMTKSPHKVLEAVFLERKKLSAGA